jgi:hypothetical protein
MEAYNVKQQEKFERNDFDGLLFKISWTLTPNTECVAESFEPSAKAHSLRALAVAANKDLQNWYNQNTKRMGNIVIIDYFQTSPILDVIKEMNGISE